MNMTPKSENTNDAAQIQAMVLEAWSLHQKGQLPQALAAYQDIIKLQPRHFDALHLAGVAAAQMQQFDQAAALIRAAIEVDPTNVAAHFNLGNALLALKQPEAAIQSFDHTIRLNPTYANAYNNRGNALVALRRFQDALASYDKAIALNLNFAEAYVNRGNVLRDLKNPQAAVESYDKAIELKPASAEIYNSRGQILMALRQFHAAVDNFDKAIQLKPGLADAYNSRGTALKELKRGDEALASYDKALQIKSSAAEIHYNRAILLNELKSYTAAVESYDQAIAINPANTFFRGSRLHTKMQICDWRDYDGQIAHLVSGVKQGQKVAAPFAVLTFTDSPEVHRKAAEIWVSKECPPNSILGPLVKRPRRTKIRLGYFSMDYRNHPTALLVAGAIEAHDREKFEVYGFSFGPDTQDSMRKRMEGAFDKFMDVREKSDVDIAALARSLEIDIAVDLAGHTSQARTAIYAMRAAPIQVNYLCYPGTMGTGYHDYLIGDRTVMPAAIRPHYLENVVYMPDSYQPNDHTRVDDEPVPSRAELGLPANGFVFCCFNNNFKITPSIFDIWMRILKQVAGSVLWLFEDNSAVAANLRAEAERRGVAAERLVFAPRAPHGAHMARHRAADLFLDTLPYNAHTTASDALWMGLPVLTCTGGGFAGRVATSLLNAVNVPELITSSLDEYEARAVELAKDPSMLAAKKQRLSEHRLTAPLFDSRLYARHIEHAFARMYELHHADLPPEDIHVPR